MGNFCATSDAEGNSKAHGHTSVDEDKEIFGNLIGTVRDKRWEDNYIMKKKLGAGITGAVYVVERKDKPGQRYALKSVNLKKLDPAQLKELRNEVALLKKLDHPHIVRLYECYETDVSMDLILELMEGGDLHDAYYKTPDKFTEAKVCELICQLVSAVAYCHGLGITHRDIKPANICFSKGDFENVKLIDFGIGKLLSNTRGSFWGKREKQTMCGTVVYVAPEILTGKYDCLIDIWAIGILTYFYLSGRTPFQGATQNETMDNIERHKKLIFRGPKWRSISAEAKDFIQLLLTPNPKHRPQAEEVLKHPWFRKWLRKSGDEEHVEAPELPSEVLHNISKYAKFSPLKKMAMMAVAQDLSGPQLEKLQQTFSEIDTNKLGTINQEEMLQALKGIIPVKDAVNIFDGLDFDKTGKIRYGEFLAAAMDTNKVLEKNSLRVAFNKLDKDNSGFISVSNLIQIAGKVYGEDVISNSLKEFDIKANGVIDFEEFLALMDAKGVESSTKENTAKVSDVNVDP